VVKLTRNSRLPLVIFTFGLIVAVAWGLGKNPATAGSGPSRKVSPDMLVTLEVFSGRPNPSWTLSADEEQELTRRLRGLPPSGESPAAGDLGYRGFRIVNNSNRAQLPSEVVVTKGVVSVRDDRGTRHYTDVNGIESWLVEQARQRGYGALIEAHS
jgi:hypothetical protein